MKIGKSFKDLKSSLDLGGIMNGEGGCPDVLDLCLWMRDPSQGRGRMCEGKGEGTMFIPVPIEGGNVKTLFSVTCGIGSRGWGREVLRHLPTAALPFFGRPTSGGVPSLRKRGLDKQSIAGSAEVGNVLKGG
jgi:hypothetical protein